MCRQRARSIFACAIFLACSICFNPFASAVPVTAEKAAKAVRGWLRRDHAPLGKALSTNIARTEAVKNGSGEIIYFVAHLSPSGFVILTADDAVDPIIAFSATGSFDTASRNPMVDIVN